MPTTDRMPKPDHGRDEGRGLPNHKRDVQRRPRTECGMPTAGRTPDARHQQDAAHRSGRDVKRRPQHAVQRINPKTREALTTCRGRTDHGMRCTGQTPPVYVRPYANRAITTDSIPNHPHPAHRACDNIHNTPHHHHTDRSTTRNSQFRISRHTQHPASPPHLSPTAPIQPATHATTYTTDDTIPVNAQTATQPTTHACHHIHQSNDRHHTDRPTIRNSQFRVSGHTHRRCQDATATYRKLYS